MILVKFPSISSIMPTIPGPLGPLEPLLIELLGKAGNKLIDKLFSDDKTKEQPAYNPEKSEAEEVLALNADLMDYRSEVKQASAELESIIKEKCEEFFTKAIDDLEAANKQFEFYRTSRLKRKLNDFLQELDGIFAKYTAKRISLDDADCLAILKMRPGDLKGQRMRELKELVFKESIEELNRKMESFVNEFFEDMEFSVDHRMAEVEQRLEEKITAFKIAESSNAQHSDRLEEIILRAEYLRSVFAVSEGIPS